VVGFGQIKFRGNASPFFLSTAKGKVGDTLLKFGTTNQILTMLITHQHWERASSLTTASPMQRMLADSIPPRSPFAPTLRIHVFSTLKAVVGYSP